MSTQDSSTSAQDAQPRTAPSLSETFGNSSNTRVTAAPMPGGPYTLDQDVLLFNIALEKAEHDQAQAKTLAAYNLCQAMTGGTARLSGD